MNNDKYKCDKHFNEASIYKICDGSKCCNKEDYQKDPKDSLLKFYEEEDAKNILTANGRELIYKAKGVFICIFWVAILLTALSVKKTLDNIDTRLHNTPSSITK